MDLGLLMNKVEQIRFLILKGSVVDGIQKLYRLKLDGHDVDVSLIEDIVDLHSLTMSLYDETFVGDAITATKCLAALKKLDYPVDSSKIDYIRFKKLSLMQIGLDRYFSNAREEFSNLIKTLQSFFVKIADYRECIIEKKEGRLFFLEDIFLRFPNMSLRDIFLQMALQRAVKSGLSFNWENHRNVLNQELTGRISWSLIQNHTHLPPNWYHYVKKRFNTFINSVIDDMEHFNLPRYFPPPQKPADLIWIVFSTDSSVSRRISASLRNYNTIQVMDPKLLAHYLDEASRDFGAFIFHVTLQNFDILKLMAEYKLNKPNFDIPFIVFAERAFFKIVKKHSFIFPGCEYVTELIPERVQNLEYIISQVLKNKRKFIRLPIEMECRARFGEQKTHTKASPISPGGTFIKTHRVVPVYSSGEVTLTDNQSGFEETIRGKVVYNSKGGSAVEFDNLISFEKFKALRELSIKRHNKILDTLKRSQI